MTKKNESAAGLRQRLEDLRAKALLLEKSATELDAKIASAVADGERPDAQTLKSAGNARTELVQIGAAIPLVEARLKEAEAREAEEKRLKHLEKARTLHADVLRMARRTDAALRSLDAAAAELDEAIQATNAELSLGGSKRQLPVRRMLNMAIGRAFSASAPELSEIMKLPYVTPHKRKSLEESLALRTE